MRNIIGVVIIFESC